MSDYNPLSFFRSYAIKHYYGDYIRRLFVGVAVLMAVAIPIWGNLLPFGTVVQVVIAILLVLLAGLTSPHNKNIFLFNTVASGFGILLFESIAIAYVSSRSIELFLVREIIALVFIFTFYFSLKTLRAMPFPEQTLAESQPNQDNLYN